MKVKYYFISVKKEPQSFLSRVNNIDLTEPYTFKLTKVSCWGLLRKEITKKVWLRKFNTNSIKVGQEIIL